MLCVTPVAIVLSGVDKNEILVCVKGTVGNVTCGIKEKAAVVDAACGVEEKAAVAAVSCGTEEKAAVAAVSCGTDGKAAVVDITGGTEEKATMIDVTSGTEGKAAVVDASCGTEEADMVDVMTSITAISVVLGLRVTCTAPLKDRLTVIVSPLVSSASLTSESNLSCGQSVVLCWEKSKSTVRVPASSVQ